MNYRPKSILSLASEVETHAQAVAEGCTACGACMRKCDFLARYGSPKTIAQAVLDGQPLADPFLCSLCGLCGAVCPADVRPKELFLAQRRQAVAEGADLSRYRPLTFYESVGHTELFSLLRLPKGGDAVFFPGCSLPGARPQATWSLWERLRRTDPDLGIALGCCSKPSHDLGRHENFTLKFQRLRQRLLEAGVRRVVVACPNCLKMFRGYGQEFETVTAWEVLAGEALPTVEGDVVVHDPCPMRRETGAQDAVRQMLKGMDLELVRAKHRRLRTLCCGEGGAVMTTDPKLAKAWGSKLLAANKGRMVVTYCNGCAGFLAAAGMRAVHLADLLHDSQAAVRGESRPARSPWTYVNRLKLKWRWLRGV